MRTLTKETKQKLKKSRANQLPPTLGKNLKRHPEWKKFFGKGYNISEKTRKKKSNLISGNKNPNWRGGVWSANNSQRNSKNSILWKKTILTKDNFSCKACGSISFLEIHHINNFSEFPELRLAIDNGITLCHNCHVEFHKQYTKYNNSIKQLNEFLCNKNKNKTST